MISMNLSEAAKLLGVGLVDADALFTGCSIDSRTVQKGNLFIAIRGEKFDGHSFVKLAQNHGACAALVENAYSEKSLPLLSVNDSRKAMARLAGSWRSDFAIPLIAVTGSNGKTTVKEMLSSILSVKASVLATRGNLNNEIGVPLTLFGLDKAHKYAVIEMGANHPGEIAFLSKLAKPTVALITQCAPAHLEGFGSIEGVARAKGEIYSGLGPDGMAIVNTDDAYADFWCKLASAYNQIGFGFSKKADISASDVIFDTDTGKTRFKLNTPAGSGVINLPLAGKHNVMNALAAAACCYAINIPLSDIQVGLEKMPHVHGRMQLVTTREGARVFDDTYNANPTSLKAGLQVLGTYPGKRWLVLGDMGELGEASIELHRQAGEMAREQSIEKLYALGNLSKYAVEQFGLGAMHFDQIEDLLTALKTDISADTTVLVKGSRFMAMDRVIKSLMGAN